MGWSARKDACDKLALIEKTNCVYGPSNTWVTRGQRYFFEYSRREHADGAITGAVYRYVSDVSVVPYGSFRIEGNGHVTRFPGLPKERWLNTNERKD